MSGSVRKPATTAAGCAILLIAVVGGLCGCESTPSAGSDSRVTRRGEAYVDAYGVVRVKPTIREAPQEPIRFGQRSGEMTGRGEAVPEEGSTRITSADRTTDGGNAGRSSGPFGRESDGTDAGESGSTLAGATGAGTTPPVNLQPDPSLIDPRRGPSTPAPQQAGGWTIILSSLSGDAHRAQAQQRLVQLQQSLPELQMASVVSTDRASMITFGRYESPDDARAQADLKRIKEMALGPMKPFALSMLSPVPDQTVGAQLSPHDLRSLRRQFPNTNPLYTLDVAVWAASAEDGFPWPEMKRRAEAYTAQLRQQGIEAYFYHNEASQISSVTVGKFDRRAVDQRSGFSSPEVRAMLEKFPRRLTNGQEMMVRVNPADENSALKPQEPQLVEVPRNF